jgi:hypothetical protein
LVETQILKAIPNSLFTEEGLEVFREEFERFLIEQRKTKTTDQAQVQRRVAEVEREISNIQAAIKADILTPTTKNMLMQAEAERDNCGRRCRSRRISSTS